jgi:hypothetical protein
MRPRKTQHQSSDIKRMQEAVDVLGAGKFTPSVARHFGVRRTTLRRQLRKMPFGKGWVENRISLQKLSKNWLITFPNGVKMIWSHST